MGVVFYHNPVLSYQNHNCQSVFITDSVLGHKFIFMLLQFPFGCWDKNTVTQINWGVENFNLVYTSMSPSITERSQSINSRQDLEAETMEECFFSSFLQCSFLASFLMHLRADCLRMVLTTVNWTLLDQLVINKISQNIPRGQSSLVNASIKAFSDDSMTIKARHLSFLLSWLIMRASFDVQQVNVKSFIAGYDGKYLSSQQHMGAWSRKIAIVISAWTTWWDPHRINQI